MTTETGVDDRPLTVLIADDEELTRTGLRTLLSARPGLDVVGEAIDGTEVLPLVTRLCPDVVLMDVRMPGVDGIEATRRLRAAELPAPPRIVVITTFENDSYVYDALRAGADGFLLKRTPVERIARAIRLVAEGDSLLFPDAIRSLLAARPEASGPSGHATPAGANAAQADHGTPAVNGSAAGEDRPGNGGPHGAERLAALTAREREVLRLMAAGLSNPAMATRLTVGLETIKTHVSNVLAKLGAENRTQAVILAYESGLVIPGVGGAATGS
ncbi:response regulator [Streptomyces sp. URMC 123]|uniref:response regulator n=1 Tax=Streptomyces sp. URMC 123 TaxID=3423403 RepID=UPI003F1C9CA0